MGETPTALSREEREWWEIYTTQNADAAETMAGRLFCAFRALESQLQEAREDLTAIKHLVVGEARPLWDSDMHTTATRGHIADICDAALSVRVSAEAPLSPLSPSST